MTISSVEMTEECVYVWILLLQLLINDTLAIIETEYSNDMKYGSFALEIY